MTTFTKKQQNMINDWKVGFVLDFTEDPKGFWPILTSSEDEKYSLTDLETVLPFIVLQDKWYEVVDAARPKQLSLIVKYDTENKIKISQNHNYMLIRAIFAYDEEVIKLIINYPTFIYYNNENSFILSYMFDQDTESLPTNIQKIKFVLKTLNKVDKFLLLTDIVNEYKKKENIKEFITIYESDI